MLLASGQQGHRSALPNASIMLHQPRSMARGQASDIAIKAKEVRRCTTFVALVWDVRFDVSTATVRAVEWINGSVINPCKLGG